MLIVGVLIGAALGAFGAHTAFQRGYALGERHGRENATAERVAPVAPLTVSFSAPWLSPEYAAEIGPEISATLTRLKSRTPLS